MKANTILKCVTVEASHCSLPIVLTSVWMKHLHIHISSVLGLLHLVLVGEAVDLS
jgi:hypothetical protein